MNVKQFENEKPQMRMEEWFVGNIRGDGAFYDRFGSLKRRFTIWIVGRTEGELIVLDERLRYSDGEEVKRRYEIRKIDEHHYEAKADGVVGVATIESYGNALRWRYQLLQAIGGSDWKLTFDDWMWLHDEDTLLNRAEVSKWGINLGQVVMTARREGTKLPN